MRAAELEQAVLKERQKTAEMLHLAQAGQKEKLEGMGRIGKMKRDLDSANNDLHVPFPYVALRSSVCQVFYIYLL